MNEIMIHRLIAAAVLAILMTIGVVAVANEEPSRLAPVASARSQPVP